MSEEQEPAVAELVSPDEYGLHEGRVVRLDAEGLHWVPRVHKVETTPPSLRADVETIPAKDVAEVRYRSTIAVGAMLLGLIGMALAVGAVLAMIEYQRFSLWVIGAVPVLFFAGLVFVLGGRRRRIDFRTQTDELFWLSGALEFKDSRFAVFSTQKWAEKHQIPAVDFPSAQQLLGL